MIRLWKTTFGIILINKKSKVICNKFRETDRFTDSLTAINFKTLPAD